MSNLTMPLVHSVFHSALLSGIPHLQHAFGTKSRAARDAFGPHWANRAIQKERHGTTISVVDTVRQQCGEADGMLTAQPAIVLGIMTADCLPLLLARGDGSQVAALHIGWRGLLADMVGSFTALLRGRGDTPAAWSVAIGPGAGACCYEVGDELIGQFQERYPAAAALVAPRHRRLDTAAMVRWQLERDGYGAIDTVPACTICHGTEHGGAPTFHSYRRDRATRTPNEDIQWSAIMRTDTTTNWQGV
jgi:YfiH family protein